MDVHLTHMRCVLVGWQESGMPHGQVLIDEPMHPELAQSRSQWPRLHSTAHY